MTSRLQGALTDLDVLAVGTRVTCRFNNINKVGTIVKMSGRYVSIKFDDDFFNAELERHNMNLFTKDSVRPLVSVRKLGRTLCLQNYTLNEVIQYRESGELPKRGLRVGGRCITTLLCGNANESSLLCFGLPQNVWRFGIFGFLSPNEVTRFGSSSRDTRAFVESVRASLGGGSLWSRGQFCIIREDYSEGEMIGYEGPYAEIVDVGEGRREELQEAEVFNVYRMRTVRFLLKTVKRNEFYQLEFRSGLYMYTENAATGGRNNEMRQRDAVRWVDCCIRKKIRLSNGKFESFVMFETIPYRDPAGDWLRTGFRLHNSPCNNNGREADVGCCGFGSCEKCNQEKLSDGHLHNMSVVSECNLRWCLGMYTNCALRFDELSKDITGSFPRSGAILKELPPLLLNRYVVGYAVSGDLEVVCGSEPPILPINRFSRVPPMRRYLRYRRENRARRRYKKCDCCYFEYWLEYNFSQLPWHNYYASNVLN